ncbi:MAG: alanine racemase [Bacteroidetes bacterium]|nr:alanine racemase [Bacteroidota bacterium]
MKINNLHFLKAQISASAVKNNLQVIRKHLRPNTRLCSAVKADAYGHRINLLVDIISESSDMLAVSTPYEAIELRSLGYHGPILMFQTIFGFANGAEREKVLTDLITQKIIMTLVSQKGIPLISSIAQRLKVAAEVHIIIDTGMGRSGILADDALDLIQSVEKTPGMKLTGIYTHFADAGADDKTFTFSQLQTFKKIVNCCNTSGLILHTANSAATIDIPETHLDMVRPGLSIYGYQPSDTMHKRLPLQPALRLIGRLTQTKRVKAGTSCGYGLTHTFAQNEKIGIVPIGYGDGYLRCLSNRAVVSIGGKYAPIRGRVSMDQIIVELTDIPGSKVGDEVEIISPDPTALNSVENLARLANTIPYEITCRLGRRINRVLVPSFT